MDNSKQAGEVKDFTDLVDEINKIIAINSFLNDYLLLLVEMGTRDSLSINKKTAAGVEFIIEWMNEKVDKAKISLAGSIKKIHQSNSLSSVITALADSLGEKKA